MKREAGYVLVLLLALAACGGGGDGTSTTATVATVPGAPTIGLATAGDSSASISFAAPASPGSAAITGYAATCTANSASVTVSAAGSPIVVTGLSNGTTYTCSVTASSSVGVGAASGTVSVTPAGGISVAGSTAPVLCNYSYSAFNNSPSVNNTSTANWTCSATQRSLIANGLPDHDVGTFPNPNNPNMMTTQLVSVSGTLTPAISNATGSSARIPGYVLNGVKLDPGTAGTCDNSGASCNLGGGGGTWSIEALTNKASFNFGDDFNNAHVQPGGAYHYHGIPEGFVAKLGRGTAMTLVGWAADGFPIYARYGYTAAADASSATKVMVPRFRLKTVPDAGRPSTSLYAMGSFTQDWTYDATLAGDLDECNGRTGVTPEFPNGIYYYVITEAYPFIGRCLKGTFAAQVF